jgi:hypothetical protein
MAIVARAGIAQVNDYRAFTIGATTGISKARVQLSAKAMKTLPFGQSS